MPNLLKGSKNSTKKFWNIELERLNCHTNLYKNLFESLKKNLKKKHYSEKNTNMMPKTWSIMKEVIGKIKLKSSRQDIWLNMLSYRLIKLLNLLNTINILWVFLSTYLKPLIQPIIQYFLKTGIITCNWKVKVKPLVV